MEGCNTKAFILPFFVSSVRVLATVSRGKTSRQLKPIHQELRGCLTSFRQTSMSPTCFEFPEVLSLDIQCTSPFETYVFISFWWTPLSCPCDTFASFPKPPFPKQRHWLSAKLPPPPPPIKEHIHGLEEAPWRQNYPQIQELIWFWSKKSQIFCWENPTKTPNGRVKNSVSSQVLITTWDRWQKPMFLAVGELERFRNFTPNARYVCWESWREIPSNCFRAKSSSSSWMIYMSMCMKHVVL